MSEKGLGRGLSALFGEENVTRAEGGASLLPLSKIYPNQGQPRREFDEQALNELAESIKTHGLITPIAVRKLSNGGYQIIAGERRWRACRIAGLSEVPAVVLEADEKQMLELALIENLQREDLNPFEEAEGFKTLIDDFGMTQESVSERVGKSRPAVANALRLLALPEQVKQMVTDGSLSAGHARALLALETPEQMIAAAEQTVKYQLTVRQTEDLVKKALSVTDDEQDEQPRDSKIDYAAELSKSLTATLGRKVKIIHGKSKGKIELEYYGLDDLECLKKILETGVSGN